MPSKKEGDSKVDKVKQLGDKVIPESSLAGQQHIRREVETLNFDWQRCSSRLNEARDGLEGALRDWNDYDALHDDISKWLRDTESALADNALKATLAEKKAQLDKYQVSGCEDSMFNRSENVHKRYMQT